MNSSNDEPTYLSTAEAAVLYDLSQRVLLAQLRDGHIPGHKERGPRGSEWRVTAAELEAAGYRHRGTSSAGIENLLGTIGRLRETERYQRRRADELDGRLGQVSMELGRLRGELRRLQDQRRVVDAVPEARSAETSDVSAPPRPEPPRRGR